MLKQLNIAKWEEFYSVQPTDTNYIHPDTYKNYKEYQYQADVNPNNYDPYNY